MDMYQRVFKPTSTLSEEELGDILDILEEMPLGIFLVPIRSSDYYVLCGLIDEEDNLAVLETAVLQIGVFANGFTLTDTDWQTIRTYLKKKEDFLKFSLQKSQETLARMWWIDQTS